MGTCNHDLIVPVFDMIECWNAVLWFPMTAKEIAKQVDNTSYAMKKIFITCNIIDFTALHIFFEARPRKWVKVLFAVTHLRASLYSE